MLEQQRLLFFCLTLLLLVCSLSQAQEQKLKDLDLTLPLNGSDSVSISVDPVTRTLFINDRSSHRVLRYESLETLQNSSSPQAVFGQSDLQPHPLAPLPSISTFNTPSGIFVDYAGTLWVTDTINNRVLWFNGAGIRSNKSPADGVVGQVGFSSAIAGCDSRRLRVPTAVSVDQDGALWIVDQGNHRVLRFDGCKLPTFPQTGAVAAGVLGQNDFLSGSTLIPPSGRSLSFPAALYRVSGQGLYVADPGNHRVTYYSEAEAQRPFGGAALYFLGQINGQATANGSISASTLEAPVAVAMGGNSGVLFVSDFYNNRVLFFDSPPTTNNQPAASLIGQTNFITADPSVLALPFGLHYDDVSNALYVVDTTNKRVLRFASALALYTLTNLNVEVQIIGNSPQARILPKDSAGRTYQGRNDVVLSPTLLEEIDASGNVVNSSALLASIYEIAKSAQAAVSETFVFSRASVQIKHRLFQVQQALNSAGISFFTEPNSLKFELSLGSTNFSSPSNHLRLHLHITTHPSVTTITKRDNSLTNNNVITFILDSEGVMTTEINLISMCRVDNISNLPVNFTLNVMESVPGSFSLLDLVLELPFFNQSLVYDPDFSVTLIGGSDDGGDGDDNSLLGLLALIVLVIPVSLILIALVVLLGVFVWRKLRLRRFGPRDDVNF